MASESVDVLIEGGKATAAPPLGPALGPLGVNIGQVVSDINKKTQEFKGMQVPVTVTVDPSTKAYTISVGTPPASALIKKEADIKKGAGNPLADKVADLVIEQIIKIAIMKEDDLLGSDLKAKVKEIVGTCQSMGVLVEGKPAHEVFAAIDAGKFDRQINNRKTEITAEEKAKLEEEKKHLQEELEKRREEFMSTAKGIVTEMSGKEASAIKTRLTEAGIPTEIINEVLPKEEETAAKPEAKPATEKK